MKKIKKLLGFFGCLFLFSGSALAHVDHGVTSPAGASFNDSAYGFFRAGFLFILQEYRIGIPTDRRRLGAHGSVGFMKPLTPRWAIGGEVGPGYYGRATGAPTNDPTVTVSHRLYGLDAAFVALYRVTRTLSVRGRVGGAVIVASPTGGTTLLGTGTGGSENSTYNTNFLIGAGVMYAVVRHLSLTADYTYIYGSRATNQPRLNVFQLGIEYRFAI